MNVDKLKQTLIQHKAELAERQQRVARYTRHRDEPLPPDFAEQAVELENEETLVALDNEISQKICQIDHALRRIEADQYLITSQTQPLRIRHRRGKRTPR